MPLLYKPLLSVLNDEASDDGYHYAHSITVAEVGEYLTSHQGRYVFAAARGIVGHQNSVKLRKDGTYLVHLDDTVYHTTEETTDLTQAVAHLMGIQLNEARRLLEEVSDASQR